jgi:hypothetical protein
MTMLTNADQLIDALKVWGLVNITWGGPQNMLCGNPLHNLPMLDISCSNEKQAWISRGDEALAREHVTPLIRKPVRH